MVLNELQSLLGGTGRDGEIDVWLHAGELPQIGKENILTEGGRDTDPKRAHAHCHPLTELVDSGIQGAKGLPDRLVEEFSLRRQNNSLGGPDKKLDLQLFLQLLDGLGYGRLADVEPGSRLGDISAVGDLIENPIPGQ